jgi:hypothetical protein
LADGNVAPSKTQINQLRGAIRNIVDTRTAGIGLKTATFTPDTAGKAITPGLTLAALMSRLAYWRIEYGNKINTHIAVNASYDAKGHVQIDSAGGLEVTVGS